MPARAFLLLLSAVLALMIAVACSDDDSAPTITPSGTGDASPLVTPASVTSPPLEGPSRGPSPGERTDFRQEPGWILPDPDDRPEPDDADDPVVNPPSNPSCPAEWIVHDRLEEGFKICFPGDWTLGGNGYVNAPNEDRWYSAGFFDFVSPTQEQQRAHVSVYVMSPFVEPFRYTIDCQDTFSITFAGEPAVVCPDFETDPPGARIVSYHVFREDLNYFVQVVGYFGYDPDTGEYSDDIERDSFDMALTIAHTFQFRPVITP